MKVHGWAINSWKTNPFEVETGVLSSSKGAGEREFTLPLREVNGRRVTAIKMNRKELENLIESLQAMLKHGKDE